MASDNSFAHRNLGGCLLKMDDATTAVEHLRRATELKPDDQQAWYGLAQASDATGDQEAADQALIRTIAIAPRSEVAGLARQQRTKFAHASFRERSGGAPA